MIANFLSQFDYSPYQAYFCLKDMEQKTGFLVHLAMAYPLIVPFLRGLYLEMNSWRPGRNQDGWKLSKRAYNAYLNDSLREGSDKFSSGSYKEENAPIKVKAVFRLFKQLEALYLLFGDNEPALRLIRGTVNVEVIYIFGGASGSGFGDSFTEEYSVGFIFGAWNEEGEGTSSNYQ